MDFNEKIMQLANISPLQPTKVAKALGNDSFMASAMLSELVGKGKLKISSMKVGSSPLYYIPEKEEQLKEYVKYLNEKDQRTATLLLEKKVLRDQEIDPLTRVSLRNIKDFAKPLDVQLGEQKEIFWKWYLLTNIEAEEIIKQKLNLNKKQEPEKELSEPTEHKTQEKQHKLIERSQEKPKQDILEKSIPHKQNKEETNDDFFKSTINFFKENNITLKEYKQLKKNKEYTIDIEIKTTVGELNYHCISKNKKRITDSDLSNAYVQGQMKKLPVLFLSNGELTKKAIELLKELKGITFKKI